MHYLLKFHERSYEANSIIASNYFIPDIETELRIVK
jgi:hypothetical protein